MKVVVELSPEQLPILARMIAKEIGGAGGRRKPYDVNEAAEALGLSADTIRRRVAAGTIKRVPDVGRVLIPAPEIDRMLGVTETEGGHGE